MHTCTRDTDNRTIARPTYRSGRTEITRRVALHAPIPTGPARSRHSIGERVTLAGGRDGGGGGGRGLDSDRSAEFDARHGCPHLLQPAPACVMGGVADQGNAATKQTLRGMPRAAAKPLLCQQRLASHHHIKLPLLYALLHAQTRPQAQTRTRTHLPISLFAGFLPPGPQEGVATRRHTRHVMLCGPRRIRHAPSIPGTSSRQGSRQGRSGRRRTACGASARVICTLSLQPDSRHHHGLRHPLSPFVGRGRGCPADEQRRAITKRAITKVDSRLAAG